MPTADSRIPVTEDTHELLKEKKPEGVTFDHYLRRLMGVEDPVDAGRR